MNLKNKPCAVKSAGLVLFINMCYENRALLQKIVIQEILHKNQKARNGMPAEKEPFNSKLTFVGFGSLLDAKCLLKDQGNGCNKQDRLSVHVSPEKIAVGFSEALFKKKGTFYQTDKEDCPGSAE